MNVINNRTHHAGEIIYELPSDTAKSVPAKFGEVIFTAYGCVLTERQTKSGMYVYTAVNIKTGRAEPLSRKKIRLAKNAHAEMAARIYALPIRGESAHTTEKKPDESKSNNSLINTARHIFKEILPQYGYAVREKQIELSEHILEVISRRGISLAESEVGTGKTHAYLIAALLAKRGRLNDGWLRGHYTRQSWAESAYMPVVISTSSIALQKAIVTDYIPELSRILTEQGIICKPLTAVIRKGKEHYICEKRLNNYPIAADEQTKARLKPFIGMTAPFDLTGADSLTPYMKRRICVMEKCSDNCRHKDNCRYTECIKTANSPKVDFQITNHNYFLADVLHRTSGRKPLLPNYQLVVIESIYR